MILWLVLAAITLLVVGLLLLPLLRRPPALASRSDYDLSVYREQLLEIDRDVDRGVLTASEAKAARTEVERRVLRAAEQTETQNDGAESSRMIAAVTVAALLPIVAFIAYQQLGAPHLAQRQLAQGQAPQGGAQPGRAAAPDLSAQQLADVDTMIASLAERAESNPDDLEAWLRLGRAYGLTGRPAEAVDAFRAAMRLSGDRPDIASEYGESLVLLNGGRVVAEAQGAFTTALAAQPQEPRARYYMGLAAAQAGDWQVALDGWTSLAADSEATAPWMPTLRQRIVDAAKALGLEPASLPIMAKLEAAESQASLAPQNEPSQAEIEAMVAGLAARLESDPDNFEGWLMLARSYSVLDRLDLAQATIDRAAVRFARAPFLRQQIAEMAAELGLQPPGTPAASAQQSTPESAGNGPSEAEVAEVMALPEEDRSAMIRGMVEGLAARLESQPDDLQGWLMLLRSYRVIGEEERLAESLAAARAAFAEQPAAQAEIERLAGELGLAAPGSQ